MNNVPFLCTKLFQKRDTIQEGTLFKGGQYLRKYGIYRESDYQKAVVPEYEAKLPINRYIPNAWTVKIGERSGPL